MSDQINIILGLAGVLVGIPGAFVTYKKMKNKKTWRHIRNEIDRLISHISDNHIQYDYIVSPSGGGLIIAELIAYRQQKRIPIISIPLDHAPDGGGIRKTSVLGAIFFDGALADKSVLVVDDVVRTGQTMAATVNHLLHNLGVKPENLYTACIGKLSGVAGFNTDYCSYDFSGEIHFPWGPMYSD